MRSLKLSREFCEIRGSDSWGSVDAGFIIDFCDSAVLCQFVRITSVITIIYNWDDNKGKGNFTFLPPEGSLRDGNIPLPPHRERGGEPRRSGVPRYSTGRIQLVIGDSIEREEGGGLRMHDRYFTTLPPYYLTITLVIPVSIQYRYLFIGSPKPARLHTALREYQA